MVNNNYNFLYYFRNKFKTLLVILSNAYGLFIIILCLGNGLIDIPTTFYLYMYPEKQLKIYEFQAIQIYD